MRIAAGLLAAFLSLPVIAATPVPASGPAPGARLSFKYVVQTWAWAAAYAEKSPIGTLTFGATYDKATWRERTAWMGWDTTPLAEAMEKLEPEFSAAIAATPVQGSVQRRVDKGDPTAKNPSDAYRWTLGYAVYHGEGTDPLEPLKPRIAAAVREAGYVPGGGF